MKQFEDRELVLMAQIIDASSQRGIFKGPDLKTVGEMYEKITNFLPKQAPQESSEDAKK